MSLHIQEESTMRDPTDQVIDAVRQVLAKLPHAAHYTISPTDRITQTVSVADPPFRLLAISDGHPKCPSEIASYSDADHSGRIEARR